MKSTPSTHENYYQLRYKYKYLPNRRSRVARVIEEKQERKCPKRHDRTGIQQFNKTKYLPEVQAFSLVTLDFVEGSGHASPLLAISRM